MKKPKKERKPLAPYQKQIMVYVSLMMGAVFLTLFYPDQLWLVFGLGAGIAVDAILRWQDRKHAREAAKKEQDQTPSLPEGEIPLEKLLQIAEKQDASKTAEPSQAPEDTSPKNPE